MDREQLNTRIAKAIENLPLDLDGLIERGRAMEVLSANPEGSVPVREHLDTQGNGGLFYSFADGAGNSESLWIIPSGESLEALYLTYDHESPLNFYSYDDSEAFEYQSRLYSDLPLDLKALLSNGPEGELLNIVDPEGDQRIYHGSGVLFLQDGLWTAPESYIALALSLDDDGGLRYISDTETLERESGLQ